MSHSITRSKRLAMAGATLGAYCSAHIRNGNGGRRRAAGVVAPEKERRSDEPLLACLYLFCTCTTRTFSVSVLARSRLPVSSWSVTAKHVVNAVNAFSGTGVQKQRMHRPHISSTTSSRSRRRCWNEGHIRLGLNVQLTFGSPRCDYTQTLAVLT